MSEASQTVTETRSLIGAIKPYFEKESLAAFFVGVSSGFPYAMIGATVTAAILVGIAGATYDIVIDAYRIETLKP